MQNEQLKKVELFSEPEIQTETLETQQRQEVQGMYEFRLAQANQVKPYIYLGLFNKILEKIEKERAQLLALRQLDSDQQEVYDQYSFVLDSQYFEQRLM